MKEEEERKRSFRCDAGWNVAYGEVLLMRLVCLGRITYISMLLFCAFLDFGTGCRVLLGGLGVRLIPPSCFELRQIIRSLLCSDIGYSCLS